MDGIGPHDAHAALAAIERGRLRMLDELDVPHWYWWTLACGWVVLGVLTDLGSPVLTSVATLAFGAAHASVAPRVIDGRRRTHSVRLRADAVTRRLALLIIAALVLLAAVTVAGSVVLAADGAGHPVTIVSVVVAVLLVFGGPELLSFARRRAARTLIAG